MKDWPAYPEWSRPAFDDLMAKQDHLEAEFQLGHWPRFDYDLAAATLTFSDEGAPKVVAEIEVVGSTAPKDWLWAWDNAHLPKICLGDIEQVRTFGREHHVAELTSASVVERDLNELGWRLTAVAARVLDRPGAYRAPDKKGALFMLIR